MIKQTADGLSVICMEWLERILRESDSFVRAVETHARQRVRKGWYSSRDTPSYYGGIYVGFDESVWWLMRHDLYDFKE